MSSLVGSVDTHSVNKSSSSSKQLSISKEIKQSKETKQTTSNNVMEILSVTALAVGALGLIIPMRQCVGNYSLAEHAAFFSIGAISFLSSSCTWKTVHVARLIFAVGLGAYLLSKDCSYIPLPTESQVKNTGAVCLTVGANLMAILMNSAEKNI